MSPFARGSVKFLYKTRAQYAGVSGGPCRVPAIHPAQELRRFHMLDEPDDRA
jgi:hypothetical protein